MSLTVVTKPHCPCSAVRAERLQGLCHPPDAWGVGKPGGVSRGGGDIACLDGAEPAGTVPRG